jgi:hypothetical protein
MNFITDNFVTNFFNNSAKTDEDLDKFINKKFTYYLNNSNLLLNFVSDFEDYKNTGRNDNKSKCDECENLYILTSEIFENYINRVKIPFDITVYSEGKEKSNINYNNKVLYFFDLKDLNKILQSKNLARNNEDTKILNKKRILCKIISLSFIKIYIIIKSIYQTFNIYSSLIKTKTTIPGNTLNSSQENLLQIQDNQPETPPIMKPENPYEAPIMKPENPFEAPIMKPENPFEAPIMKPENQFEAPPIMKPENQFEAPPVMKPENPFEAPPVMKPENPFEAPPVMKPENQFEAPIMKPENPNLDIFEQPNTQPTRGGGIFDFLNPFQNEIPNLKNEVADEYQPQKIKLQTSSNVFYSIFVILFENTENELTAKNFNADYLNNKVNSINNENLVTKLPSILKYICSKELYLSGFILKNSIIFNDDNFKFLKLKTSDTLENDATFYLKEIDEKNKKNTIDNTKKLKESQECFTKENVEFIENYCKNNNFDLTNLGILNSIKGILQKMIANYFKNRNKLYDTIIKKIIKFNPRTNEIENINPGLTYAKIVDITEQTKNILLDLHIDIFKSLNSIVNKIRTTLLHKYGNQLTTTNNVSDQTNIIGGKTRKKYYKKSKKYTRK